MADLTYPKSVRLHHRKAFEVLLDRGSTHYNAVFKVFWHMHEAEDAEGCRFAVSVPKRTFKRAVKRNLLKRRTREAIRLNRACLPEDFAADFLFFYRAGEVCDYADIEKAVVEAFSAVAAKVAAAANPAPTSSLLGMPQVKAFLYIPLFSSTSIEANSPSAYSRAFAELKAMAPGSVTPSAGFMSSLIIPVRSYIIPPVHSSKKNKAR